ncbi:MAG TPA: glycosyltransferase family 39 protein, partial [Gemmataceae bacterium]|nr:glycosyltransferase family 39 protein [Gemmataceae bacterium]
MLLDTHTANRLLPTVARCEVVVAPTTSRPVRYRLVAACLILASVLFHLAYLLWWCPLDLAPDEAHYWLWSRHLDWSYYSKGPLVAWLMRASCELFGTSVFAVRFPAVMCHAALLAGLFSLTLVTMRCHRTALAVVALALTLPGVTAAAVVMTIDPPFLACWCWALVFAWKAIDSGRLSCWVGAGLCSALGVLAKYPMLLLPLAVGGFLLVNRPRALRRRGYWVMLAITAIGCVPILLWNAANGWVSFRHVFGQAGGSGGVRWLGPLAFAGGQGVVLLGYWFAAFARAAWQFRRSNDSGLSFLWWVSVPVWAVFLLASLRTTGQVNWPAAAYLGGLVLTVVVVKQQLVARPRVAVPLLAVAIVMGAGVSVVAHFPGVVRPVFVLLAGSEIDANRPAIRRVDPTCRLRGWQTLAKEVDAIRDRVRAETGTDPAIAGMVWTTPGEL